MSADNIRQIADLARKALEQQQQQKPDTQTAPAADADVARFEQAVNGAGDPQAAQGVGETDAAQKQALDQVAQAQDDKPLTPGERILKSLTQAGEEMQTQKADLVDRLNASNGADMKDMIALQMQTQDLTMKSTLLGKAGEKGNQGIKSLFTGQ